MPEAKQTTTSSNGELETSAPQESPASEDMSSSSSRNLGTFQGVFRPTVLTILGLMMYVREGWIVGNAGLLGAVLIIALTFLITGTAALSLSSITTNIHVGPGGSFSIISQSLGLETGGSIGVPLYLGQALSSALYIYGFTEAWRYIFPHHPQLLVAYAVFVAAFATTFISTRLAFRLQSIVMVIILVSLGSIALGLTTAMGGEGVQHVPQLWGTFTDGGFWVLFAVFFPGGTGIQVGASMSGALKDSRKSIPRGTLTAVGTALLVYLGMAVWYSVVASPEALRAERLIVIDRAAVGELVLAGILASTFVAALSGLVAAPRVLQALAEQNIIPKSSFFDHTTEDGEPRRAMIATGLLVTVAMLLGSLNAVAKLITMFFLLIYLTINIVMALEKGLGLVAFRPTFRIPFSVPLVGIASCMVALFIISPTFALVALAIVFGIYVYLVGRHLETPWQTVRSSIFVSLADWASKKVMHADDEANERAWKPDLLVPVLSRGQLDGIFRFLRLLAEPKGSLKVVGIRVDDQEVDAPSQTGLDTLPSATRGFQAKELLATSVVIEAKSFIQGVDMSASVLRGSAFKPNILFGLAHRTDEETLQSFVDIAGREKMGAALLYEHPEAAFGQEHRINVWASDQSPNWELGLRLPNLDLSVLLGYQVLQNWDGQLRLLTVCKDPAESDSARAYLQRLIDDARLPGSTQRWVEQGDFLEKAQAAPEADLSIFGLAEDVDKAFLREIVHKTRSSCLFVRDSGHESALA